MWFGGKESFSHLKAWNRPNTFRSGGGGIRIVGFANIDM